MPLTLGRALRSTSVRALGGKPAPVGDAVVTLEDWASLRNGHTSGEPIFAAYAASLDQTLSILTSPARLQDAVGDAVVPTGSGTLTAASTSVLTDGTKNWGVLNTFGGLCQVEVTDGVGTQWDLLLTNSATTLTLYYGLARDPGVAASYKVHSALPMDFYCFVANEVAYRFPEDYAQSYVTSGTWSPLTRKICFYFRCSKNMTCLNDYNHWLEYGVYMCPQGNFGNNYAQAVHFYHFLSPNLYADRWVYVELQAPDYQRDTNSYFDWPVEPELTVQTVTTNGVTYEMPNLSRIINGTASRCWTVTCSGTPTGGTWTISLPGHTTAPMAATADVADIRAALLAAGFSSDSTVTGGPLPATFWVDFQAAVTGPLTVDGSSLTGGATLSVEDGMQHQPLKRYWDSWTYGYFQLVGNNAPVGSFYNCTWQFLPIAAKEASIFTEPLDKVRNVCCTYNGSAYELWWTGLKSDSLASATYKVYYSTAGSIHVSGLGAATDGGTVPTSGQVHPGARWTGPPMAEADSIWFAIQPQGGDDTFYEIAVVKQA